MNYRKLPYILILLLLLASCTQTKQIKQTKVTKKTSCFPRIGNCIQAQFGDHPVTPLTNKDQLYKYKDITYHVDSAEWQISSKVDGRSFIKIIPMDAAKSWFGNDYVSEIEFIELGEQSVQAKEFEKSDQIRIAGDSIIREEMLFTGDQYPSGDYLFFLKLKGKENWDQKVVFVTVG